MSIGLTNAFDIALAPYLVDCLNTLGLWAKVVSSLDTREDFYEADSYTLHPDFDPIELGTFPSASAVGNFMVTYLPDFNITSTDPSEAKTLAGIIFTAGSGGTDVIGMLSLGGIVLDAGATLTVTAKFKLSDKGTPEV